MRDTHSPESAAVTPEEVAANVAHQISQYVLDDEPNADRRGEMALYIATAIREAEERGAARERGRAEALRTAIELTLSENRHLADGDNCTLLYLKQGLRAYDKSIRARANEVEG